MPMPGDDFEHVLDRRFGDFERLMDARMVVIQQGQEDIKSTLAVFINKVSTMHVDYVPRTEIERENARLQIEVDQLKTKVETLEKWRNYMFGAIAFITFILGVVAQSQLWK